MNHAEAVLYTHLTDVDSLDVLAREGLDPEVIPSETGRKIVSWSIDYYYKSGRTLAPTADAILAVWADDMARAEITLGDGTEGDSIEFAIDTLKANWVHWKNQEFLKEHGRKMAKADGPDRARLTAEGADRLFDIARVVASKRDEVDARTALADRMQAYEAREAAGSVIDGMTTGLAEVDNYMHGIHPGELCMLAAPPKTGKSFFSMIVALNEWERGRRVLLYTLENSVEETLDRLICFGAKIDYHVFQRGEMNEGEKHRGALFAKRLASSEVPLLVQSPEPGRRSTAALVRRALTEGAQSLIVDQTSHVEATGKGQKKWESVDEIMKEFTDLIGNGRERLPLLLLHQINREGVKAARKDGRLYMDHLSDGAAAERYAHWVLGLYRSDEDVAGKGAKLTALASRRERLTGFELTWDIANSLVRVRNEIKGAAA